MRFFTPTEEVDLCGHATIATYSLLFQRSLLKSGSYKQELKAGVLGIEVQDDGLVIMEQSLPQFSESIPLEVITDVFDKSIIVDGFNTADCFYRVAGYYVASTNRESNYFL